MIHKYKKHSKVSQTNNRKSSQTNARKISQTNEFQSIKVSQGRIQETMCREKPESFPCMVEGHLSHLKFDMQKNYLCSVKYIIQ